MPRMVFINLPVASADRAAAFYTALGGRRDAVFCSENTAMMWFADNIAVMLLEHARFADFTPKTIADAHTTSEVLVCFSADSREDVDAMLERAEAAGGRIDFRPPQDYGTMYGRSFEDLDGHIVEVMWMDLAATMKAMEDQKVTA